MKKLLIVILLLILIRPASALPTNGVPLNRGYLQSPFDINFKAMTNGGTIAATNFHGNGLNVTNLQGSNVLGVVPLATNLAPNPSLTNTTARASGAASTKALSVVDILGTEQLSVSDEGVKLPAAITASAPSIAGISEDGTLIRHIGTITNDTTGHAGHSTLATNASNATNIYNGVLRGDNRFPTGAGLAFQKYSVGTLANGANSTVPIGTNINVELSGNTAAATLHGLWPGVVRDGDIRLISYRQIYPFTIAHESGIEPFSTNRIRIATATDRTFSGPVEMIFKYSLSEGRWLLVAAEGLEPFTGSALAATTATNAPDTSALVSTNILALREGWWNPQHLNLGKTPRLLELLKSNMTVRVIEVRDNAFEAMGAVLTAFTSAGYRYNGTGLRATDGFGGLYSYPTLAGTYNSTAAAGWGIYDPLWTGDMLHLGNAATCTMTYGLTLGIDTDTVSLKYFRGNGHGTLTIYTNAYGVSPAAIKVIDCNNSGAVTPAMTNFSFPLIKNCYVSVTSSGTNIMANGVGQYVNQVAGGVRWDVIAGQGIGWGDFTHTPALSNAWATFFADYDVLIVSDINSGTGDLLSGGTNLNNLIIENHLNLDVVGCSSVVQSNANPTLYAASFQNRENCLELGRRTPFVMADTQPFFAPTNMLRFPQYYSDETHLSADGLALLGKYFVTVLGWDDAFFAKFAFNDTKTNRVFIPVSAWRDETGPLALAHMYSSLGATYRTWGVLFPAGAYGANSSIIWPGDELGQRRDCFARYLIIVTNSTTMNFYAQFVGYQAYTNITGGLAAGTGIGYSASAETSNTTLGASGQTNMVYSPWYDVKPTGTGPWIGWAQVGSGSTSKGHNSYCLGIEIRADPPSYLRNFPY